MTPSPAALRTRGLTWTPLGRDTPVLTGLDLHVEADTLTIEGEVALDMPSGVEPSYVDVGTSKYRRVFTLSKELDAEKVSADLKNGVLTLRIPKAAHAQPRKIEVAAG